MSRHSAQGKRSGERDVYLVLPVCEQQRMAVARRRGPEADNIDLRPAAAGGGQRLEYRSNEVWTVAAFPHARFRGACGAERSTATGQLPSAGIRCMFSAGLETIIEFPGPLMNAVEFRSTAH